MKRIAVLVLGLVLVAVAIYAIATGGPDRESDAGHPAIDERSRDLLLEELRREDGTP